MVPKNCPHCGTLTSPAGEIDEKEFSAQCPCCKATVSVLNPQYNAKDFDPLITPSTKAAAVANFAAPLTSSNLDAPAGDLPNYGAQAGTATDPLSQNIVVPQPSYSGTPPAISPGSEPSLPSGNVEPPADDKPADGNAWR